MGRVMKWLLRLFGLRIVYVCEWGVYKHQYDSLDAMMGRPIHKDMSVAPPWATARIIQNERQ